nr:MAG TPA: tail protein [Caudoviricetes sp.]
MGKILMPGGGGGADLDVITAGAEDVLAGKVIVDKNGEPLTGTMADQGNWNFSELAAGSAVTIPEGKHGGGGKVTAKSLASQTPGDSAAGHILAGRTAWVNGSKITGTIPSQAGGTLTPSTSAVTANCSGKYMTSNYTIPAFALPPANALRKGYSYTLYGKTVTGTLEQWLSSPADVTGNETGATKIGTSTGFFSWITSPKSINVFCGSNGGSTLGRLNTAVNVSSYKYLKLFVPRAYDKSGSQYYTKVGISLQADGSGVTYGAEVLANSTVTNFNVILDVTNYNGMYFIYVSVRSASTTKNNGIMGGTISLSNS